MSRKTYSIKLYCSNCHKEMIVNIPYGQTIQDYLNDFRFDGAADKITYPNKTCPFCGCKTLEQ